jgi:hypothetical protein
MKVLFEKKIKVLKRKGALRKAQSNAKETICAHGIPTGKKASDFSLRKKKGYNL